MTRLQKSWLICGESIAQRRIIKMGLPPQIEQSRCMNLGQNYTATSLVDPSKDTSASVNNENEAVVVERVNDQSHHTISY
jgi:hypothetical protein